MHTHQTPNSRFTAWAALLAALLVLASPAVARLGAEQAEELYRQGQDSLAAGRYGDAADQFRSLSQQSDAQVDRALYWQAYAEAKAGRKQAALASLDRLAKRFPDSQWLDDARVLELELGGVAAADVAASSDDDMKLYALDALHQIDPERAAAMIEEFLQGNHSMRLKSHALFILAQTETRRAAEYLLRLARDGSNPELQRQAIQALGISEQPQAIASLAEIYRASNDTDTRRQILQAMIAADAGKVTADLAIAETNPDLRGEAILALGAMEAIPELERVAKAVGPQYRGQVFQAYGIAGATTPLLQVIRQSQDPAELGAAIRAVAIAGFDDEVRKTLLELYRRTGDRAVKSSVLEGMMIEDDAKSLLEIFRSEKDPELKRQALQLMAHIDDPEVEKLLESLLKN